MRREVLQRLEALEKADTERVVVWTGHGIDPDTGDRWLEAGWEIVPMNVGSVGHVWRQDGESDDDLKARAAAEANKHRGVVVCFAMQASGVTR